MKKQDGQVRRTGSRCEDVEERTDSRIGVGEGGGSCGGEVVVKCGVRSRVVMGVDLRYVARRARGEGMADFSKNIVVVVVVW
jgi:hypothetical protein